MSDPVCVQLLDQIGKADEIAELRRLRDQVHIRMEVLLSSSPVEQFYIQLNEAHDALIRRVLVLAEAEMARMGKGSPPVPYAYLLFGSGGREEQTLSSDQDSGLVYYDPNKTEDGEVVEQYYRTFASLVVNLLQETGYPPCEGNVISSNPQWCKSISGWKAQLDQWFDDAEWEVVRYLLIVADGRMVYGETDLFQQLQNHFYTDMLAKPVIVKRMLENTMRHKMLLGIFGQLLKEQYGEEAGSVDIKYGAYIPIVNAVRMLAIQAGIRATSTLARIRLLQAGGKLTDKQAEEFLTIARLFLKLRLMTLEHKEEGMYASKGMLANARLTKSLIEELKNGLKIGKRLQRSVYKQTMNQLR